MLATGISGRSEAVSLLWRLGVRDSTVKCFLHGKPGLPCISGCPVQQPLHPSRRSGIVSTRASVCVCACVRVHTCVLGVYIALFVCLFLVILIPRGQRGK